jgi:2-dehydropantoate 2-reductase
MRIAVMGSGGFGGYFGALLARGGADVEFIARGAHLETMQREGLRVEGGPEPFHLEQIRATDDPREIGPVDLVMLCVSSGTPRLLLAKSGRLLDRKRCWCPFKTVS